MDNFPIIKGFRQFYLPRLEHLTALEDPEYDKSRCNHQQEGDNPRPACCSKPSELHIHTEEARDESRRHEHEGDKGKHLHDLVLIEVDDTENSVLQVLKSLKAEVGVVDK